MRLDPQEARALARRCSLFSGVPAELLERVLDELQVLEFSAGERVLVEAGSAVDGEDVGMYILLSGQLLTTRAMPDGRAQRLSTMSGGEFFGELALADEGTRSATVTAVTDSMIGLLPSRAMRQLIAEAPTVMRAIAATLARRLRAADEARLRDKLNEERLSVVGRAAAMLMHDLRNPLGVVKNGSEFIIEGIGDASAWAAKSRKAAGFMLDLVQDLLEFAKGHRVYVRSPVDVRQIIEDIESFGLEPLQGSRQITVRRDFDGHATLMVDQRAISRALLNLIRNAVEAMPDGGTLTVAVSANDNVVTWRVSDTGRGIPDHVRATLFEPFASHGKSSGTGLGLTMAKAAVEGHGGELTVETELGKGTTFTITLPVSEGREAL